VTGMAHGSNMTAPGYREDIKAFISHALYGH
jgi:hypothetical protein